MSEIESGLKEYIEHFGKEIVKNLDELNFYYKHEFIFFCEFLEEKNTAVFSLVEGVSLRTQKGMAQS